jgi:hypothetical protein
MSSTEILPHNSGIERVGSQLSVTNKLLQEIDPVLIPYRKGNKWGFCTPDKKIVIDCIYDETTPFVDGLALVRKGSYNGYIDKSGNAIIPIVFKGYEIIWCPKGNIAYKQRGIVKVKKHLDDGTWQEFYFDKQGREVASGGVDDEVRSFSIENGGVISFSTRYELTATKRENKWGFVNKSGKVVIPFLYDEVWGFSEEGLARVMKKEYSPREWNRYGFINKCGEVVVPFSHYHASSFSEGMAVVYSADVRPIKKISKDGRYRLVGVDGGYIDNMGELAVPYQYGVCHDFSDGLALVCGKDGWGFINKKGIEVVSCIYDSASEFFEDIAAVELNGKTGFINRNGDIIIPFIYDKYSQLSPLHDDGNEDFRFYQGLARVSFGDKWGYIDKKGTQFWED